MRWNVESHFFSQTGCIGESLATRMSHEFQSPVIRLGQTVFFCPVVIQLAWLFIFLHASHVCFILASHHSRVSREFQSRVTFLLHTLDQIFTLSYTQPLHYLHVCFILVSHHLWVSCEFQSSHLRVTHSWSNLHTFSHTSLTLFPPKYRVSKCWITRKFGME